MAKDLTVKGIEALKPGLARREIPDGHTRGLFYVLQPSGAASWAFRFRLAGKPKKLTIGPYPEIDLPTARDKARGAAQALARGEDPAAAKRSGKLAARAAAENSLDVVENVAATFIERYAKKQTREKTWKENERLLTREVVGPWRGRRLSEIRRADVHELLDKITDRPAPIVANRTLAALRRMCSWAEERSLIAASPCGKVRAPAVEKSRDRILNEGELRAAWRVFDGAGYPFGPLAKLLLLTGQRLLEVGEMRWTEVDLVAKTWTIPKERCKNGVAHEVPLADAAVRVLEQLPRVQAGRASPGFVFTTNARTPASGFSKAKAGFDAAIATTTGAPLPHWTLHDLRRTAASGMAGLGIAPHVIEAVLNHKGGAIRGVAAIYNRYGYGAEKRAALDAWGRNLETLVNAGAAGNVVDVAGAR